MNSKIILFTLSILGLMACSNQPVKEAVAEAKAEAIPNPDSARFTFTTEQDTTIENGESIMKYPNGNLKMLGKIKNGKRDGLWKSFYENGVPWSETTFAEGIRNGKTTTWYENGKKRYEGFYTNDVESGKWTYWKESGEEADTKDFDKK